MDTKVIFMIIRKSIYILLDILLIFGALAGIATIKGGKWISTVVAFYQPTEMADHNRYSERAPEGTGRISTAENSSQTMSDCLIIPVPAIPEWYDVNAILATNNDCGHVQDTPANQP